MVDLPRLPEPLPSEAASPAAVTYQRELLDVMTGLRELAIAQSHLTEAEHARAEKGLQARIAGIAAIVAIPVSIAAAIVAIA